MKSKFILYVESVIALAGLSIRFSVALKSKKTAEDSVWKLEP